MARSFVIAVVAALCLIGFASCLDELAVQGKVYCDTCRVAFETKISYPLAGATVVLECNNRTTGVLTHRTDSLTDKDGNYKISVSGDHEEEICQLHLAASGDPECNDHVNGTVKHARVALTNKNGVAQATRYANPLFFSKKVALPNCPQVLLEMGVLPPGLEH